MAANWTLEQVFDQMYNGQRWSGETFTYAFPSSVRQMVAMQGEGAGFRAVDAGQQTLMVLALATWDDLIPQAFAPGAAGSTHIEFGYTNTGIGFAHGYFPPNGSIYFNANSDTLVNAQIGRHGFVTFIHEIGHTMGLHHMGDYNGDGNWSPSSYQDTMVLSVMSYFGPRETAPNYSGEIMPARWTGADGTGYSPQTPMLNDIMSIQRIYGVSTTTRTGDTVYGFHSNVGGTTAQLYDFSVNRTPILTIFDSAGVDTLDLSGWSAPSRIDLAPGAFTAANGMTNNIAIAYNTTVENAVGGGGGDQIHGNTAANRLDGGSGNDELYGLDGDDVLVGGSGNDLLDGGGGTDTATFNGAFGSYTITVSGTSVTLTSSATGTDRTVSVERFQFSDSLRTLAELSPGSDSTAPLLTTLSPADNAAGVAASAHLVLSFNEAVKAGSGAFSIFNADGSLFRTVQAGDTTQVSFNGATTVIDLGVDLIAGRSYFVTVAAGAVTDLAGNAYAGLGGSTAWNFATASSDSAAPQLLSLQPADDSSAVSAGSNLVMSFNEPVSAGGGNLVIRSGTQVLRSIAIGDTSQVSITGSTVTINPATDLPAGAAISVSVDAGALRDAAGNAYGGLTGTTAWNFSVAAAGGGDDYPDTVDTPGVVSINGSSVGGRIELIDDVDLFRVDLLAGVAYTFDMQRTGGGLPDPVLVLLDGQLTRLAVDDDSGGSGNARLGWTPTRSGTYFLGAFDYGSGTGGYTVRAATLDTQPPTLQTRTPADDASQVATSADLELTFDEAVTAGPGLIRLLDANGAVLREIRADDATAVRINGRTVTIDPGAHLPAGSALSVTVDGSAFRDAAGNAFAGLQGTQAWNFTTASVTAGDDYPMSVTTGGVVRVNAFPMAGSIDFVDDGDLFRVALTAGVTYRFDLVSPLTSAVDPYLMLFGTLPEVELIAYDDDSGPLPLDSQLYFTPSGSGEYFLAAFDYAEATGAYSIGAVSVADDYLGSTATSGRVTVGSGIASGRVDAPSDVDMFAVTLSAGKEYSFELQVADSAGLDDPYLSLVDAQGNLLASDDDSGIDLDSLLTYTAPSSGTYYLAAMDYDTGTGGYQLSGFTRNRLEGGAGPDRMTGTSLRDSLHGGAGDDLLRGAAGDDVLHGGDGTDIGRYAGSGNDYYLENMGEGGWVVRDLAGNDGRDLAYDVERLQFDDGFVAIDVDGRAGTTARYLGAVFGADAAYDPEFVGIGLALLDLGWSDAELMEIALDAALPDRASDGQVVDLLYLNLFGVLPPAADRAFYVDLIEDGVFSRVTLAQAAADTEWNLENIDWETIQEIGLPYLPFEL